LAIAGGVNVLSDSKLRMHSYFRDLGAAQDCRSYTAKNGMHLAECASAVLLKPLSKAIAAGDPIRAVIRWSHTCHIGGVDGKVVPNMDLLAGKIATSLRKANVDARTIGYMESACTGFKIGDEMEMTMLNAMFKQFTDDKHFCRLGTVKSNMGHAEAASGIAQFAKVLLQFDHRQLVPLLNFGAVDPQLDLSDSPFQLQWELEPWPPTIVQRDGKSEIHPRRALINSLGMGGTFSSVLIDEYVPRGVAEVGGATEDRHVIVLSAKNRERLQAAVQQMQAFVNGSAIIDLASFAYTLQVGREAMRERIAVVASNLSELQVALAACGDYLSGKQREDLAMPIWSSDAAAEDNVRAEIIGTKQSPLDPMGMAASTLAASWVKGAVVAWQRIYKTRPGRMLLPQYPFGHARGKSR
jgi:polyketide synthase PksN